MNNKFTKVLPLCVAAFLALPFVTEHAYAAAGDVTAKSTSSGTEATLSVEENNGVIKDYGTQDTNPWTEEQKEKVDYVTVADGTKVIGKNAVSGMKALETVRFPKTLEQVKDHAFEDCDKLKDVVYEGTKKQYEKIEIGHEGNEPLKKAEVEALTVGVDEVEFKTKEPVVGVDPEGCVTTSNANSNEERFTIDEMWEETEGGKVKASSARWNGELEASQKELFDKFKAGTEYKHTIRLTIPKSLVDEGYRFDETTFVEGAKIKVDGRNVVVGSNPLNQEKTVATFTDFITGVFAAPAGEDTTTGDGNDPKPEEVKKDDEKKAEEIKKAEEVKKAAEAAKATATTEASNSEFYKTGDASVLPLISTMLTSGLAAFASRKKKD